MTEESWVKAQEMLQSEGLNLLASTMIDSLPEDFLTFFEQNKIPYKDYHSIVLIAHGGKKFWECLPKPISAKKDHHPIDEHSLRVFNQVNEKHFNDHSIYQLYPHHEVIFPLQKLGRFLGLACPTPMGIDINADYGPWFAYRLLFLTQKKVETKKDSFPFSPCEECSTKDCLKPISFWEKRLACPYKNEHQYSLQQQNYHQDYLRIIEGNSPIISHHKY